MSERTAHAAARGRRSGGRLRRGHHRGEALAVVLLLAKGYRIIGRRVVLVEVKRRSTMVAAEACATPRQRQRVLRAADLWLSRHESCRDREIGFDLIFILPWRWPQHLQNKL